VRVEDPTAVARGPHPAIEAPRGTLPSLRALERRDRLDELAFELPLAGGDAPTGRLVLDAIGAVLRTHLPADDPLAGYAERLSDPALRGGVRGYLTGTIDLVARAGGRFTVVDYKTNWLGATGAPLTAWHYRPAALAAEMQGAHYGLQALLYQVALHRFLRWRLADYDPDRHLGGVLYLFMRGMTGAPGCGVFRWQPSGALVAALSDVLDRGGAR
jgi:exodeoxyribonuclease V beta subunit